jgi:hypothetical protein
MFAIHSLRFNPLRNMSKMLFPLALCLLLAGAAAAQDTVDTLKTGTAPVPAEGPVLAFTEKSHDFGDIRQGDKVSYTFTFTNTGTAPLIITNVATTCGCTATGWTKEPVAPGKSGEISATFDSKGKMNRQHKVITIHSNSTTGLQTVSLITNVLPGGNSQR